MNVFKRKALTAAVLGTLGVAGSAHAIYQDPNNTGQALIYPYYTVNSAGGNAFNPYLSPNDMWTGAVIPASADAAAPAHLVTADVSCTNPTIPSGGVDFRNFQYSGGSA